MQRWVEMIAEVVDSVEQILAFLHLSNMLWMKNFNLTDVDHMYDQNNYTIVVFKLLCYKYKNDNFFYL